MGLVDVLGAVALGDAPGLLLSHERVYTLYADLIGLAADSRLVALLQSLFTDHHEDVRYNSLIAAAELAGTLTYNQARQRYESLIFTATRDRVPTIASQAWIILGLLDPVSGFEADWRRSPPETLAWATPATRSMRNWMYFSVK